MQDPVSLRKHPRQIGAAILEYIVLAAVLVLGLVFGVSTFRNNAQSALDAEGNELVAVAAGQSLAEKYSGQQGSAPSGSQAAPNGSSAPSSRVPSNQDPKALLLAQVAPAPAPKTPTSEPNWFTRNRVMTRLLGLGQTVGGVLEVGGGAVAIAVPEPTMATKVLGGVLIAHGADTTVAGWRTFWNGEFADSLTYTASKNTAEALGADEKTAERIGTIVDVGAGFITLKPNAKSIGAISTRVADDVATKGGVVTRVAGATDDFARAAFRNTRRYKSGARAPDNLLLNPKLNKRRAVNLTEWRRSIKKTDLKKERLIFLGDDAVKIAPGIWRSLDGTRQFRSVPADYLGKHGIGSPSVPNTPHAHFEFLAPPNAGGNKYRLIKNIHVPIK